MSLFGVSKVSKGTIQEVSHMVEHFFRNRNMNAHSQQIQETAGYGWWLTEGTTKIYIFVQETPAGPVLRVTAPILHSPASNLEALYRRLLDLNQQLSNCAFATHKDIILVVAQRHTPALNQEEFDEIVSNVAYVANTMSEKLSSEFNTRPCNRD